MQEILINQEQQYNHVSLHEQQKQQKNVFLFWDAWAKGVEQKNVASLFVFLIWIYSTIVLSNGNSMGHEPLSIIWATQVLNSYSNVGKITHCARGWLTVHQTFTFSPGYSAIQHFSYVCLKHVLNAFSLVWLLEIPWTVALQAPLSMGFSRQEYWSGLPFPTPGNLPNPGIKPASPVLAGGVFTTVLLGGPPN